MDFKHEILNEAVKLRLPAASFRALGVAEWEPVIKRIEETFVAAPYNSLIWWWERFKKPCYSTAAFDYPPDILDKLIPAQELV
ncbi:hypothetical protein GCM10023185_18520 [Hymenobacter saemangeumensis]|uniref:Uncharacterized protein n=1 Tax=Hymenobacter saemangeumensis TaxID=1084522 RepID=A0ABP8IC70_9BACT